MTPKEHIEWFYEKFNNGLERNHTQDAINREKRDQQAIISLIEEYKCESVLEIGTWEGQTGLIIWLWPRVKKFIAIDVHKDMKVIFDSNVHNLSDKEFIGHYLKNTKTKVDFIDSMKWDVKEWQKENGQIDLVFIDANHDVEHCRNDTLKALQLKPKVIVWHDVLHINLNDHVPIVIKEFIEKYNYNIQVIKDTEIGFLVL